MNKTYPFQFKPILKEIIWGGKDILPFKGLPADNRTIGESWELSHVEGNHSVVANGSLEGQTIDQLIHLFGQDLLGKQVLERFGTTFPLLIKFIDARDDLSIQVHPDDTLAQKRHQSFGKTEMWYVVKAEPGSGLYSGFSQKINAEDYVNLVDENRIMDVLKRYEVKEGDVFFLPAGRVHAIGAGCFIAEIQQTSNITYRIFDYNRKDTNGSSRELHTELAKDAIDYTVLDDYRTFYEDRLNDTIPLVNCNYFTTNLLELNDQLKRDFSQLDSFVIYMCTSGSVILLDDRGNKLTINQGQTILLPANTEQITLLPQKEAKLLETYIQ